MSAWGCRRLPSSASTRGDTTLFDVSTLSSEKSHPRMTQASRRQAAVATPTDSRQLTALPSESQPPHEVGSSLRMHCRTLAELVGQQVTNRVVPKASDAAAALSDVACIHLDDPLVVTLLGTSCHHASALRGTRGDPDRSRRREGSGRATTGRGDRSRRCAGRVGRDGRGDTDWSSGEDEVGLARGAVVALARARAGDDSDRVRRSEGRDGGGGMVAGLYARVVTLVGGRPVVDRLGGRGRGTRRGRANLDLADGVERA